MKAEALAAAQEGRLWLSPEGDLWIQPTRVLTHPRGKEGHMKPVAQTARNTLIYDRVEAGERKADLAREFGIGRQRIDQICKREARKRPRPIKIDHEAEQIEELLEAIAPVVQSWAVEHGITDGRTLWMALEYRMTGDNPQIADFRLGVSPHGPIKQPPETWCVCPRCKGSGCSHPLHPSEAFRPSA